MHSLQIGRIRYLGEVKYRALVLGLALSASVGFLSAISPKPKTDPVPAPSELDQALPINQEATEQSVVPGEPALLEPEPAPESQSEVAPQSVQPLPQPEATAPAGPTQNDLRKRAEIFRAAKTEAEQQPELAGLKDAAFAARTEREKRSLLHEYYQSVSAYIIQRSPGLKDSAELWTYGKLSRLSQQQTDPAYVAPTPPAALQNASPASSPKAKKRTTLPFRAQ